MGAIVGGGSVRAEKQGPLAVFGGEGAMKVGFLDTPCIPTPPNEDWRSIGGSGYRRRPPHGWPPRARRVNRVE